MSKAAELAKMGEVLTNSQIGGRRNLILNPKMQVAQRGTSTAGITTSGFYTVDRFEVTIVSAGTYTMAQSTTVPSGQGFSNSIKMDCTTADASLSGTDQVRLSTYLEGQDLQQLKYGTSEAESLTLQFWVKSNKTGTYIVWFIQPDDDRQNAASYTINSADTWEKKTITISGDTTGVIDNDNGRGLEVSFILGAGSDYTSGTAPSNWEARVNANRYAGQTVNLSDSTDNEWLMTGFQMEVGSQATPFEHRSLGEEILLCQRYYQEMGSFPIVIIGSNNFQGTVAPKVVMRSAPTVSTDSNQGRVTDCNAADFTTGGLNPAVTANAYEKGNFGWISARFQGSGLDGGTNGDPGVYLPTGTNGNPLQMDAEL